MTPIHLSDKTKQRLVTLVTERDHLNRRIDEIVATVRDERNVPGDWVLMNLDAGFVPPPSDTASTDKA